MASRGKTPFELKGAVLPPPARAERPDHDPALEAIKKLARDNLETEELVRIAWTNRFKVPRYPSFDHYTPEEALLELWEQHFYENPNAVDFAGIHKRKNRATGISYYVTGDPVLDELEAAFGRGERPDMSVLNGKGGGRDVFRAPVFTHSQRGPGFEAGQAVAPHSGLQGVQEGPDGAKITAGGAKVTHTDFTSDDWLKASLEEDSGLKAFADLLKGDPRG